MKIEINKGDVIFTGKFKNKKQVVKSLGKDDKGQPTVNGRKVLTFRMEKLMKESTKEQKENKLQKLIHEEVKKHLTRKIVVQRLKDWDNMKLNFNQTLDAFADYIAFTDEWKSGNSSIRRLARKFIDKGYINDKGNVLKYGK